MDPIMRVWGGGGGVTHDDTDTDTCSERGNSNGLHREQNAEQQIGQVN